MSEVGVSFDSGELGQINLKLQRVCLACNGRQGGMLMCEDPGHCPVGFSIKLLLSYLKDKEQIRKDLEFGALPKKPVGVQFDRDILEGIFSIVPGLCQRCMFHADKCFLNILYTQIETMLEVNPAKPSSKRPGEA